MAAILTKTYPSINTKKRLFFFLFYVKCLNYQKPDQSNPYINTDADLGSTVHDNRYKTEVLSPLDLSPWQKSTAKTYHS